MAADDDGRRRSRAIRILVHIDGTLLADIRSMRHWATSNVPLEVGMGRLNFALMAVSLIGCERLGLLTTTATNRAARAWPELTDPGRYIIEFIETYFPRKHPFKRISKILADAMRHELVHGFGGRRSSAPFELALYVSADKGRFYEVRERRRRRPLLTVNSVAFADAVLGAAGDIRRRLDREPRLVERILNGAAARFKTPEGVLAEWEHRVRRGSQIVV